MTKTVLILKGCLLGLLLSTNSAATEFCVTSSAGLEFSLAAAEGNGQSDVIKIAQGVYEAPLTGFSYFSTENFDLSISGGWVDSFGNPCGQQLNVNAFTTVLDANTNTRALFIGLGDTSDLSIAHLFFANGNVPDGVRASGLWISPGSNHSGKIIIENNAFINNQAGIASALSISGSDELIVRNNLFVGNQNSAGYTVEIYQNDASGVYFTNNTVYQNSQITTTANNDSLSGSISGVLLNVNGSSQAFIANNVFWDNETADLLLGGDGFKYLKNNDVGISIGMADAVSNNISVNPLFEVGLFNYTPAAGSQLINAGLEPLPVVPMPPSFDQNWEVGMLDVVGDARVQMGGIDMGAFESAQLDIIFIDGFEL